MKRLLAVICILGAGCTVPKKDVDRLMKHEGITEWQDMGYSPFSCSNDDTFSLGFKGKKNGQVVQGVVCGGIMKGNTIRYY